jgi:hypothetical protein
VGEDEEMKRRALIAATTGVALGQVVSGLGQVVSGLGEFAEVALPNREQLPARLGMVHVHTVEAITEQLRGVARQFGGQADLFSTTAQRFTRWMQVPATEAIKTRLAAALAELHTEAGWCCHDSGLDATGHFTRAIRLAGTANDAYGIANAAWHAGLTLIHNGHPNDALKLFQLGQIRLGWCAPGTSTPTTRHTDDPRLPPLAARLNRQSATAYALLNKPDQAQRYLTQAHEGWTPPDTFERAGAYLTTAVTQLDLHRLDTAEHFAASAVRTYSQGHHRDRIWAQTVLAEVHVRAGEPQGLTMAHHAITEVSTLHSAAARQRLVPLATALEARPHSDTQQLAQIARKITATRI